MRKSVASRKNRITNKLQEPCGNSESVECKQIHGGYALHWNRVSGYQLSVKMLKTGIKSCLVNGKSLYCFGMFC